MHRWIPWALVALLATGWYLERRYNSRLATQAAASYAMTRLDDAWQTFELADLLREQAALKRPYLPFLDVPTLSTGLYVLPAGGTDAQQPHERDEVYYVLEGRARFSVAEDTVDVKPGTVLYVKARVPHRFFDITEDLRVLVFFAGATAE